MSEHTVFVPSGGNRQETAVLLVGTAAEYGINQRSVRVASGGFFITEELADIIYGGEAEDLPEADPEADTEDVYNPADFGVKEVKEFVTENPDSAADVLDFERNGKNRPSLVDWLATQTSGDRAAKNTGTDKE